MEEALPQRLEGDRKLFSSGRAVRGRYQLSSLPRGETRGRQADRRERGGEGGATVSAGRGRRRDPAWAGAGGRAGRGRGGGGGRWGTAPAARPPLPCPSSPPPHLRRRVSSRQVAAPHRQLRPPPPGKERGWEGAGGGSSSRPPQRTSLLTSERGPATCLPRGRGGRRPRSGEGRVGVREGPLPSAGLCGGRPGSASKSLGVRGRVSELSKQCWLRGRVSPLRAVEDAFAAPRDSQRNWKFWTELGKHLNWVSWQNGGLQWNQRVRQIVNLTARSHKPAALWPVRGHSPTNTVLGSYFTSFVEVVGREHELGSHQRVQNKVYRTCLWQSLTGGRIFQCPDRFC